MTGILRELFESVRIVMGCFRKVPKSRKTKNQGKGKKGLVKYKQVTGQRTYLTEPYA